MGDAVRRRAEGLVQDGGYPRSRGDKPMSLSWAGSFREVSQERSGSKGPGDFGFRHIKFWVRLGPGESCDLT